QLDVTFPTNYYTLATATVANGVRHQAQAKTSYQSQVRDYATGIYFTAGSYEVILCKANDVNTTVNAPSTKNGSCTNGGTIVK
ncbi:MAG: hypothetical protein ABEI32_08085, partial [Halothece sp.]